MSLVVMEDQSQPVFRDFLGSAAAPNPEAKQPELSATDSVRVSQNSGFMEPEDGEASVRGGSTFSAPCPSSAPGPSFPASSDPGTELWRHGKAPAGMPFGHAMKAANSMNDDVTKKREELGARSLYNRENDMVEGSRPSKTSRFKQRENDALPSTGDLGLTMQPPRTSQVGGNLWLQASAFNPSTGTSKRIDPSRPGSGVPLLGRPVQVASGATATGATGGVFSRNPASSIADEGSRTGLQGGGIAALINSANAKLPSARPVPEPPALERSASLDRPKPPPLQNGGSDSLLPSHKTSTTSATRQLTIFYGGHAHVFDDVSPEKADAIMQMAGSNGRSWSTTYAHRSSRSEGSLADLRREKVAIGASSLTVPSDNQNAPSSHAGLQRKHRIPPDHHSVKVGIPGDVPVPSGIPIGDGNRFAMSNGRATAGLHGSFYNMKEAASNGPHWL